MKKYLFFLSVICLVIAGMNCYAQMNGDKSKRPSPPATTSGKIGSVNVVIDYSAPSVKGRKIFGGLEQYGSVWRAGANEATTISFDKNVTINGKPLEKGKYAFFILLKNETSWTLIFNKNSKQWGTEYDDNKAQDALKVGAVAKDGPLVEKLHYSITNDGITLNWEKKQTSFKVEAAK